MVFVNDKKFACEACIKGHRSSSCTHSQRPLFEVAKKGRPVSQCPTCRQLRQDKKYHSKCKCPKDIPSRGKLLPSACSTRRYIAIRPALPNGLQDRLVPESYTYSPAAVRQKVDSLLNPCECQDGRKCKQHVGPAASSAQPHGTTLAPILVPTASPAISIPSFGVTQLPPMRILSSLAGSGCICGVECICPGCVEHRGPVHAAASGRGNCADGCGACVDSSIVVLTPYPSSTSSIDRFLACAAALPAPPTNPREVVKLPKLECCAGRCACPPGQCGCGKSCGGCCEDQDTPSFAQRESNMRSTQRTGPLQPQKKSCCGG
ncbi:copper fist DNA binding domain-containing protein [Mycena crocata]|nr:copper fist DNA binding domain-containing protein [Mycena crocata]